jgi:Ran GTPase-activating protein (RanGAP) involved in mRNA processing and transport
MKIIRRSFTEHDLSIAAMNFKFSFLNTECCFELSQLLLISRTLVKLDISHNALSTPAGCLLIKALKDNVAMHDLNLSHNNLDDEFAMELSKVLVSNEVLWRVDITRNPIGERGALAILAALQQHNGTIESLGDVAQNTEMGVINIEEIRKALNINKAGKEVRSKQLGDGISSS